MRWTSILLSSALLLTAGQASAEGELCMLSWANWISPEVIAKFSKEYGVEVTVDGVHTMPEAMRRLRIGGVYDVAVLGDTFLQIAREEGLLAETTPREMPNFKNVNARFRSVSWDRDRAYSVPWAWGLIGIIVNTKAYADKADTLKLIFDPPPELDQKIDVIGHQPVVLLSALRYLGLPPCGGQPAELDALESMLVKARAHWRSIEHTVRHGLHTGATKLGLTFADESFQDRRTSPTTAFFTVREGSIGYADNVVVLRDAQHSENAKLFQNFVMDPEVAALISNYAGGRNAILGSEKFLSTEFLKAPEVTSAPDALPVEFMPLCPPDVQARYDAIWENLTK